MASGVGVWAAACSGAPAGDLAGDIATGTALGTTPAAGGPGSIPSMSTGVAAAGGAGPSPTGTAAAPSSGGASQSMTILEPVTMVAGAGGASAGMPAVLPTGGTSGAGTGAGATSAGGGTEVGGAGAGGAAGLGGESSGGGAPPEGGAGGQPGDGCPFAGNVTYRLNGAESWPEDVVDRLSAAMDEAVHYYNCYADLSHELTVNYNEGVPTAEANVDGWMSFGADRGYMVVATAMHEIGHTMGVGYYPWSELISDGRWTGPAVVEYMTSLPAEERDPDMYSQRDYITCDSQHFWPYGLNQASEHQSEWSLINHVRVVAAMQRDKQAFRDGTL